MKTLAILFVLTAGSMYTTMAARAQDHGEEELAKLNMAASNPNPHNYVSMEEAERMTDRSAIMNKIMSNMSPKQMAEYRDLVAKAKSSIRKSASAKVSNTARKSASGPMEPPHVLSNPTQQKKLKTVAKAARAYPMNYESMLRHLKMKDTKESKTQKVHTYPKQQSFDDLKKQAKKVELSMAGEAMVDKNDEKVNDLVSVDAEAIIQHAKEAAEHAKKLPRSFKEWEQRIRQKMAAAKAQKHISGQAVATGRKTQWENMKQARVMKKYQQKPWGEAMKNVQEAKMYRT